jgi:hypothetical protein
VEGETFHTGRVWGKKTCGGKDCIKHWRTLNHEAQRRLSLLADMTIQERLEYEQCELDAAADLAALETTDPSDPSAPSLLEQLQKHAPATSNKQVFLRRFMDPANAPIAPIKPEGGDSTEENELPRKTPETTSGG